MFECFLKSFKAIFEPILICCSHVFDVKRLAISKDSLARSADVFPKPLVQIFGFSTLFKSDDRGIMLVTSAISDHELNFNLDSFELSITGDLTRLEIPDFSPFFVYKINLINTIA